MPSAQITNDNPEFEQEYRTAFLIATYIQEKLTPAERDELDNWAGASKENLLLFEELTDDVQRNETLKWFHKLDVEKAKRRVHEKMNIKTAQPFWRRLMPYTVAASIIIIALTAWFYQHKKDTATEITEQAPTVEPVPGGNKAILTLSNGRRIVLDSAANGSLAVDGLSTIIKRDSVLTYNNTESDNGKISGYNTITIPKGGKYQLVLSDGTVVWLNAASTLRFPHSFSGIERQVELVGEGYFEVVKNEKMPFHVKASDADIIVLGTHFNVRAYDDEATLKATLLEGSVSISNNIRKTILKPGEQARISREGTNKDIKVLKNTDIEKETAWKEGLFIFRNDNIKDIMKSLERWYNIDVVYKTNISKHFSGTFQRKEPLIKILQYLEGTDEVHFELKGNVLYVIP